MDKLRINSQSTRYIVDGRYFEVFRSRKFYTVLESQNGKMEILSLPNQFHTLTQAEQYITKQLETSHAPKIM
jgi:hypothetical protein